MLTADGANGLTNSYAYDADGHRTRRSINNRGEVWRQIYGVSGELVAEYQVISGTPTLKKEYGYRNGQLLVIAETTGTFQWIVTDALGTPRMIADQTGSLAGIKRRDYLPFGEDLLAGVGHRQGANGYSLSQSAQPRQQFGSYERDSETGLDFAEARYYSSVQGRFTSVDPLMASAKTGDPQTWNHFVFVLNNPLRYVDPDGLQERSAWEQLTEDGRNILAVKLVKVKDSQNITKTDLDAAGKKFNGLFKGLTAAFT